MKFYRVGGAVRDQLLRKPVKEKDYVVVGARPEDLLVLGFKPVGKDFPVFLHPETHEEYALARTERKVRRGYTGFEFYAAPEVTLEEDLKRRDLTINAMALADSGEIIDPFHGRRDLEQKILRHVSAAFAEDPVRILRVARFMARFAPEGFRVAPETLRLMREMVVNGEVDALVPERIWQELQKALQEPAPEQFFLTLRACGALAKILPELDRLFGVPNKPHYHPEIDTGIHTLMVLQQAARLSADAPTRFAALLHDLGKGVTPMRDWPAHIGHEANGAPWVDALCARLKAPKPFSALARLTAKYHGLCHDALALKPATVLGLLEKTDAFRRPERFQQFLTACEADSRGRPGFETVDYPQAAYLMKCLQAARQVDIAPLLARGVSGAELAEQIRRLRINAIARLDKPASSAE